MPSCRLIWCGIIAHKERPCAFNIFSSTGSENSDEPKKTICLDMLTL